MHPIMDEKHRQEIELNKLYEQRNMDVDYLNSQQDYIEYQKTMRED